MNNPNYLYDKTQTRYELYQANGGTPYNWIFLPGGPGADSRYFRSLVDLLNLPGNAWLVDFEGNGNNLSSAEDYDFDKWLECFIPTIKKFKNAILVGHSFGGMLPLLFPEIEQHLKGFIILNSIPKLGLEEAVSYSKQFGLPDLTQAMQELTQNPSDETFKMALEACMPYYFPKKSLERGRQLLQNIPFQYRPAVWWQRKMIELNFNAKWIPQTIPTLIINSKFDCICPYTLFANDKRFCRSNIDIQLIEDAGHLPWIENPNVVKNAFTKFVKRLAFNS